jgi:hypothetical protein
MRDLYRPMLKLAVFGTYTILAVGIYEVRRRLREARLPPEAKSAWRRPRARPPT